MPVEEDRGGLGAFGVVEVGLDPLTGIARNGNDPLLLPLALKADEEVLKVEMVGIEGNKLANAEARRIEELHDRPVAKAQELGCVWLVKEALDLVVGEGDGYPLVELGTLDVFHRI